MKLRGIVTQDEDGIYIAECPSIPGCVSQGKTEADARQNLRLAIHECLEVRSEQGLPLVLPNAEASFRQGWHEAIMGETHPLEKLWDGIDGE